MINKTFKIEKAIKDLEGVSLASVNFATEKLTVEYSEEVDEKVLIHTVIDLGYNMSEANEDNYDKDHEKKQVETSIRLDLGHYLKRVQIWTV